MILSIWRQQIFNSKLNNDEFFISLDKYIYICINENTTNIVKK